MSKKLDLSYFIYDMPKQKIYSKKYFRSILLNMLASEDSIIFFFDFNKIDSLNTKYPYTTVTDFMSNTIACVRKYSPEDTIISRDGGDEFVLIMPKKSLYDFLKSSIKIDSEEFDMLAFFKRELGNGQTLSIEDLYSKYMQKILNTASINHGLYTHAITMTVGSAECKKGDVLSLPYLKAQLAAERHKLEATLSSNTLENKWINLKNVVNNYISKFSTSFRISPSYKMSQEHLFILKEHICSHINKLLGTSEVQPQNKQKSSTVFKAINTLFPKEVYISFHQYLLSHSEDPDLSSSDLQNFVTLFGKDSLSGLPNKAYFENYILPMMETSFPDKKYNALFFSTVGTKLFNEIKGHRKTDSYLVEIASCIKSNLEKTILGTSLPDTFHFPIQENSPYLIDLQGGDFIFIAPSEIPIDKDVLDTIFLPVNTKNGLPVVCKYYKDCDKKTLEDIKDNLCHFLDDIKDPIREELMISSNGLAYLDVLLEKCVNHFKRIIPNWESHIKEFQDILNQILRNQFDISILFHDNFEEIEK